MRTKSQEWESTIGEAKFGRVEGDHNPDGALGSINGGTDATIGLNARRATSEQQTKSGRKSCLEANCGRIDIIAQASSSRSLRDDLALLPQTQPSSHEPFAHDPKESHAPIGKLGFLRDKRRLGGGESKKTDPSTRGLTKLPVRMGYVEARAGSGREGKEEEEGGEEVGRSISIVAELIQGEGRGRVGVGRGKEGRMTVNSSSARGVHCRGGMEEGWKGKGRGKEEERLGSSYGSLGRKRERRVEV